MVPLVVIAALAVVGVVIYLNATWQQMDATIDYLCTRINNPEGTP